MIRELKRIRWGPPHACRRQTQKLHSRWEVVYAYPVCVCVWFGGGHVGLFPSIEICGGGGNDSTKQKSSTQRDIGARPPPELNANCPKIEKCQSRLKISISLENFNIA